MRTSACLLAVLVFGPSYSGCSRSRDAEVRRSATSAPAAALVREPPAESQVLAGSNPTGCPPFLLGLDTIAKDSFTAVLIERGYRLGITEAEVSAALGVPVARSAGTVANARTGQVDSTAMAQYPRFEVHYYRGSDEPSYSMSQLAIRDPACALRPGLAVGQPASAFISILGDPNSDTPVPDSERTPVSGDRQVLYDVEFGDLRFIVAADTIRLIVLEFNKMD